MARVNSKKGRLPSSGALSMWKTANGAILKCVDRGECKGDQSEKGEGGRGRGGGRSEDDKLAKYMSLFKRLLDIFAKKKSGGVWQYGADDKDWPWSKLLNQK